MTANPNRVAENVGMTMFFVGLLLTVGFGAVSVAFSGGPRANNLCVGFGLASGVAGLVALAGIVVVDWHD